MTLDNDPIAIKVKEIVSADRGEPLEKLKWEDRIYHDLKMYGDDVHYFFEEYLKAFDVDMTDFDFDKHFPGEGLSFNINIFSRSFWRSPQYQPITIANLVEIAKKKKWAI